MIKTKYLFQSLLLGLAVAGGTNQARATFYTIGNGGLQSGWNLNIDGTLDGGGNALVGGILLTPSIGAAINTVCLDVQGTVYLGSQYNFVTKGFNGQDGLNPNWGFGNGPGNGAPLFPGNAAAAIQNAAFVFDQHKSVLAGSDNALKAALQLAVWEALYDTGNSAGYSFTVTSGRFEASNGSSTAATTALNWLYADLGQYGLTTHKQYSGDLLQPLLSNGNPNTAAQEMMGTLNVAVPEPTTMIAGALLLLPFGASTLRFIRKSRTA